MGTVNVSYGENNVNVGPLKEIPEICVDHFFGDDLNSSAFFLSHAHTDHMVGLEAAKFTQRLNDPGVKLYCHVLTPLLLGTFPRYLGGVEGLHKLIRERKVVPLDAEKPYQLEIPPKLRSCGRRGGDTGDSFNVTVTLLPAGHCPGSVMFLFETDKLRVLHTGDFRLTIDDLKAIKHLHTGTGLTREPKKIDHLYVDTTFCSKSASLFPCRKEVIQKAIGFVKGWTSASQSHWVFIKFAAKFAHEYILLELNKTFNKKIHVTPERMEIYSHIPRLCDVVTLDPRTPFHFCGDRGCLREGEFIEMRLTSMWYTMSNPSKDGTRETVVRTAKRLNVCYSMHSSLQEIVGTIDYLRPNVVTPLVMPFRASLKEVEESLKKCKATFVYKDYQSSSKTKDDAITSNNEEPMTPVPIPKQTEQDDDENDADDEDAPNSPSFRCASPVSPASPVRIKYEGKYEWKFNFSPSPKKATDSESSGSQNNGSQEEKISSSPTCPHPGPNVRRNIFPNTPPISIEKITASFEQRKRLPDIPSSSLSVKKVKLHIDSQKHYDDEACCSKSIISYSKESNEDICDKMVIDLTCDSDTDYESNSSNSQKSQSLLSSL